MRVYIDKANLKSFFKNFDDKSDSMQDCMRMFRKQLTLYFTFKKEDIESDSYLKSIVLSCLTSGRGRGEDCDKYEQSLPKERPIKGNFDNRFSILEEPSIFLLDDKKENPNVIEQIKNSGRILIGGVGEEYQVLKKLLLGTDYSYHVLLNIQNEKNLWDTLANSGLSLPTSNLIIADRFLLTNQNELVQHNLVLLMIAVLKNVRNSINIIFYSDKYYEDKKTHTRYQVEKDKLEKDIRGIVKKITKAKKNDVYINFYSQKSSEKKIRAHDRFIITDYILYRSGDSLIYYAKNGDIISKGITFDVDSRAKSEIDNFVRELIVELRNN